MLILTARQDLLSDKKEVPVYASICVKKTKTYVHIYTCMHTYTFIPTYI